jgi:hypothetical protein
MSWNEGFCGTQLEGMIEAFTLLDATIVTEQVGSFQAGYFGEVALRKVTITVAGRIFELIEQYMGFMTYDEGDGGQHMVALTSQEIYAL